MNLPVGLLRLTALTPVWVFCAFAVWQAKEHAATVNTQTLEAHKPISENGDRPQAVIETSQVSLDILAERPLFSETRRPFVPELKPEPEPEPEFTEPEITHVVEVKVIETPSAPPPPIHTLVGVIVRNAQSIAILRNTETGETIQIQRGMSIGGWKLDNISAQGMTLSIGQQSTNIAVGSELPKPL